MHKLAQNVTTKILMHCQRMRIFVVLVRQAGSLLNYTFPFK